jgi:hypothetical protein
MALSAALVAWAPAKPGHTPADTLMAGGVVAGVVLLLAAIMAAAAMRHAIEITPGAIVVRHSIYTLTLDRAAVTSATVRAIASIDEAELTTRKNGTALFGYYSGWFRDKRGALAFCAASATPLYLVTLEGDTKCRQLVLSASPEIARDIAEWAGRAATA